MVQSPSWDANWFAASQEIHRISQNPKVHYRTHKFPPTVSILGQPNPVHIPISHLLEIHPNIFHPSTPRSPQWSSFHRFPQQEKGCRLEGNNCPRLSVALLRQFISLSPSSGNRFVPSTLDMWTSKRGRRGSGSWRQGKVLQAKKKKKMTQMISEIRKLNKRTKKKYISTVSLFLPTIRFHSLVSLSTPPPPPTLCHKYLVCSGVYNEMVIHQR